MTPLIFPGRQGPARNSGFFAQIVRCDSSQRTPNHTDLFAVEGDAQRIHRGRFAGTGIPHHDRTGIVPCEVTNDIFLFVVEGKAAFFLEPLIGCSKMFVAQRLEGRAF